MAATTADKILDGLQEELEDQGPPNFLGSSNMREEAREVKQSLDGVLSMLQRSASAPELLGMLRPLAAPSSNRAGSKSARGGSANPSKNPSGPRGSKGAYGGSGVSGKQPKHA